jgi:hypothetical protein
MRKFLAMPWNRQNTLFSRETVPLNSSQEDSVAEPVHFCAAPAPACQKFRFQRQLVKNFGSGSGSDHYPYIF